MSQYRKALDATKSVKASVARALEVIADKGRTVDLSELEVLLTDVARKAATVGEVVEPMARTETSEALAEDPPQEPATPDPEPTPEEEPAEKPTRRRKK